MEKQLALFKTEEDNDLAIWTGLPEKNREKIETIFAQILVEHLSLSLKEIKNHAK